MAVEGETLFYIDQFSDEVMPCQPYLEAWAEWLSRPSEVWNRDGAKDGDKFPASVMTMLEDVVATRVDGVWTFSRPVPDANFAAVRWAQGAGWDAENILWGETMDAAISEWFADPDNAENCDDVEYVAIGKNKPSVVLIYRADPPRLEVETVQ